MFTNFLLILMVFDIHGMLLVLILHQMIVVIIKEVLIFFQKKTVGEALLNLFLFYTDMKNRNPIQVNDLRFQVHPVNPLKIQLWFENSGDTNIASFLMILIRHREIKMISDGNKINRLLLFILIIPKLKSFVKKISVKHKTMNESETWKSFKLSNTS